MALISLSIFRIDDLMKPMASGRSSKTAVRASSAAGRSLGLTSPSSFGGPKSALNSLEAFLELACKAHDVYEGSAEIMRDNIGKPLDFLVCTTKLRSALAHSLFKPLVQCTDFLLCVNKPTGIKHHDPRRAADDN